MKEKLLPELEMCRIVMGAGLYNTSEKDGYNGCFRIPLSRNRTAMAMSATGEGWDHVSVHVEHFRNCYLGGFRQSSRYALTDGSLTSKMIARLFAQTQSIISQL